MHETSLKNKDYNILVIEDNLDDFTLIKDYLTERFNTPKIILASNFKEAKTILISNDCKIDIILLDLTLPDKSGELLINEIMPLCPVTPLIVLTGYADITFELKSLSLGVSDYIVKDEIDSTILYKSIVYNIERKKTLLELESSEKRYSDLFHMSPQPMWVYDIETLRFLDVNTAAEKHYGYTLQEFLGMTIKDIRPKEEIPELIERVKFLNENQNTITQGVYKHQKKNGEVIYVEIRSNTMPFQNTVGRIILANDITERFTYIEAIEKQNKKLKEIAWIQSHVVRAPLARMMGIIDIIKNHGAEIDNPESEKLFDYLLSSAQELDTIIKDISTKSEKIKLDLQKENKPN